MTKFLKNLLVLAALLVSAAATSHAVVPSCDNGVFYAIVPDPNHPGNRIQCSADMEIYNVPLLMYMDVWWFDGGLITVPITHSSR